MERDLLGWIVDISTVGIGGAAVAALIVSARALRSERQNSSAQLRQQLLLDHHARIYTATADAMKAVNTFTRRAEARVQARGAAVVDSAYSSDADESLEPGLAALLDRGATLSDVLAAHDEALRTLDTLWFFISAEGAGKRLLEDLQIVSQAVVETRPGLGHDAGRGNLEALIADSALREDIEGTIKIDDLQQGGAMARLRVVRELSTKFLRFEVGRLVEPPPIAAAPSAS